MSRIIPLATAFPLIFAMACGDGSDRPNDGGGGGAVPGDGGGDTATGTPDDPFTDTDWDPDDDQDDGGTGGGAGPTGENPDDHCGESNFEFEPVTPLVMLLLDKSGSMMTEWEYMGAMQTRWNTLHTVVSDAVTSLEGTVNFGLKLYPSPDAGPLQGCRVDGGVEVPIGPDTAQQIISTMPAATAMVNGGTPTTEGYDLAVTHLATWTGDNPRVVILVTDGGANCGDGSLGGGYDDAIHTSVENAYNNQDIPTYVIGIDIQNMADNDLGGVNVWERLNELAEQGGRPKMDMNNPDEKFYNATDGGALEEALASISQQLESCKITLDPQPEHPDWVEVEVDGQKVPKVDDCESEDGWVYTNPMGPYDEIELCGTACDQLKETGKADALYGCPPAG